MPRPAHRARDGNAELKGRQPTGKLINLKPALGGLAPRLGFQPGDNKAGDRDRSVWKPWRAWYKTTRWIQLRRKILGRDLYTCQKTGMVLYHKHPHPHSPVVDHIKPHNGDPLLFWDEDNLQTISAEYHSGRKQAEEKSSQWG